MKKWFFIITLILMFPASALAANLTNTSPQQFIAAYENQVRMAFKGLGASYHQYKQNFILRDVVYVANNNTYAAVVNTGSIMNIMWVDIGTNNGIKKIAVTVSDNNPDLINVLFHYTDLITNALGMYGALSKQEVENVLKGYQDSYVFSYRGKQYIIESYKSTFSNVNFTAVTLSAY